MSIFQRIANRYLEARGWQLPRETFLPEEFRHLKPVTPEGTDLAIWTYERPMNRNPDKIAYCLLIFKGKQMSKPLAQYYYTSAALRDKSMEEYIKNNRAHHDRKQQERNEKKNFETSLFYGDILYTSWGYEQTRAYFYEITEVVGPKMIKMRPINKKLAPGSERGNGYWEVVPVPGSFDGPEFKVVVQPGDRVKVDGHGASKWKGGPVSESGDH